MALRLSVLAAPKVDVHRFVDILTAPKFPEQASKEWVSVAYFFVIFGIKYVMRSRPGFELKMPLLIWNLFLAAFSVAGTTMLFPEFVDTLLNRGFRESYCGVYNFTKGQNGYWYWLFIISKLFELIDTVFIVLRKRPLLFLHWYHHLLTLIYTFQSYPVTPGFNRWGVFMNYLVHSIMYCYFVLTSFKIRVPKAISIFITSMQTTQFIISISLLMHLSFLIHVKKVNCDFDPGLFKLAMFMEVTYLILFINFFLQTYVVGRIRITYNSPNTKKEN